MGRGSTGTTCDYAPVQRHHLTEHMSGAQQGTATAGYPGPHQAAPYGRGHQQGHLDMSAPGGSAQHAPEEAMYTRSGAPAGPAHHLPTVAEEDVLAPPVGSLELVTEQEADLGELAAAAAAALRGGPALEVPPEPTRVLLVRHVAAEVVDTELQDIFQAFGDLQGLHTASKQLGFVMVAYYDLRAAISAQSTLHGTLINKIAIDVQFSPITQRGKAVNQGQVVVFNLDPDSSNDQLVWLFSKFGDVQGIKQSPQRPNQKFITFYDTRHAAAAMRAMNRAEQLNKIPSYVTPQQIASLHSVTSGPNLLQLPQLQGLDAGGAASGSGASGQPGPSGTAAWEGLSNHTTVEGLLQLVQQQQGHAAMAAAGMMSAGGSQDPSAAFNRLALDPLAANPRSLPLSDSASSIAGVPHNLLMAAGSQAGGKSHLPAMPGGGRGVQGMSGMDNSQAAAAAMYNAAAAAAADRQAVAAQQHLQLLQASEAANMLMGLNLGMDPARQQAAAAALWEQQAGKLAGMQDAAAAAAGLWPAAASSNLLGGAANMNISQLAALQELQLRQQQVAAAQQVQALQQAATAASMNPLNAAANLQAAAQILQAAGLGQLGPAASFLPNPAASAPYNASAAAQILQQAGLGLPGLGLPLPMGSGSMLGGHGGSGRGVGEGSGNNRGGGRLSRRTTDPVAEAERKAQQEKLYALDLDKISRGEDKRTTLMIKNIPNKYTQKMLLATVDEFFRGTYDFFYLPIDFKNKCNVGYAFINMVQPIHIIPLVQRFNHKKWERFNSEKVCNISYARIQGRAALVQHFQHSSLMHEDKRCRPILFTLDDTGELAGEQEPFPASTSNPGSMGGSERLGHSMGSGVRLSGLAGSSNSLRSQGGSSSSLRDLHHKHLAAQAAHVPPHH